MMVVGLTGGIGSGKTTIARMFQDLGIPVYISDIEAQKIIETDPVVKRRIIEEFGELAYIDGKYNRRYIADIVFNDKHKLQKLNNIVHPALALHFQRWKDMQKSLYIIKEAAILFESGAYKQCDYIITVTAPEQERIRRVVERDQVTEKLVRERMRNQWTDEERIKLSDEVVDNINIQVSLLKVKEIHSKLIKKLRNRQ
ncbi:Dephospho-CoA kinase [Capnocytophaga canis]|uniref:Dephospho-CoA kinase n=1 Tax=Capnocytophaga canis TaxID=1848903 RepID=A0A0B7I236_9FLAO|nr:dephospho-CoA kinase [Capnocytophaga canis]CEN42647.1 Dephospho-CoA kinase [Capnocytophaga canis]CEN43878.1 Dephospho-CoA kinase [Capnocytophaga canis]